MTILINWFILMDFWSKAKELKKKKITKVQVKGHTIISEKTYIVK